MARTVLLVRSTLTALPPLLSQPTVRTLILHPCATRDIDHHDGLEQCMNAGRMSSEAILPSSPIPNGIGSAHSWRRCR